MTSTLAALKRASRTAYDCAAVRATVYAMTGCQAFDYLAADVVAGSTASFRARAGVTLLKLGAVGLTHWVVARTSPGSEVFMFARQAVPDDMARDALERLPDCQIVILGAGLDTSGLRIGTERRSVGKQPGAFFEVDLPIMQIEKHRQVQRLIRLRSEFSDDHIVYVPCSFGENEIGTSLRGAGFEPSRPTIWVWSGVIHYLTEAAVRATIDQIRGLSAKGSELFFDFVLLEAYANPKEFGFDKTKVRFDSFGEVMSFGFHLGTQHVSDWLGKQGLVFTRLYTNLDMVSLYERKTGHPAPSSGTLWSHLCVAAI
jgi:methyltransferase (TIGR00027 family)